MINFLLGASILLNIILMVSFKAMAGNIGKEIKEDIKKEYRKKCEAENVKE